MPSFSKRLAAVSSSSHGYSQVGLSNLSQAILHNLFNQCHWFQPSLLNPLFIKVRLIFYLKSKNQIISSSSLKSSKSHPRKQDKVQPTCQMAGNAQLPDLCLPFQFNFFKIFPQEPFIPANNSMFTPNIMQLDMCPRITNGRSRDLLPSYLDGIYFSFVRSQPHLGLT